MSKDKILAIKNSLLISMEKVIFPSVTFLKTLFVKNISVQKDFLHIILLFCQEVATPSPLPALIVPEEKYLFNIQFTPGLNYYTRGANYINQTKLEIILNFQVT